jgi:hypothetical protein
MGGSLDVPGDNDNRNIVFSAPGIELFETRVKLDI